MRKTNQDKNLLKRILGAASVLLILATVFVSLVSCTSENQKTIDQINGMFASNAPTKIEISTKEVYGENDIELNGTAVLVKGKYDGKNATIYTYERERFSTIEEGSTEIITPLIVTESGKKEYLEGKGVRVDGGRWDDEAYDFAPEVGAINLNLSEKNLANVMFEDGVFYATIEAAHTSVVLGEAFAFDYDVELEIKVYDGFITSITLSYVVPEDDDYPEIIISIVANYYYGIQSVTVE